jgi:hypothetical protein
MGGHSAIVYDAAQSSGDIKRAYHLVGVRRNIPIKEQH